MRLAVDQLTRLGFAVALTLLLLIGAAGWWSTRRYQAALQTADRASQIIDHLQGALQAMVDAETGQRGYVITGEEEFLAPYRQGIEALEHALTELRALTQDDPLRRGQVRKLETEAGHALGIMAQRIVLRRSGDMAEAQRQIADGQGKAAMDELRELVGLMKGAEEAQLRQRTSAATALGGVARGLFVGCTLVALLLVGGAGELARRSLRRRQAAEAERDRFFDLSLDMLCISKGDGYFKRLSPAFTVTLGWSVEELLTRPFMDFVHPDDHVATLAEVKRQVEAGEPVLHFENRYRHQDGSYRILSWRSVPQPGGLMYATARDVTEQRQAEQALEQARQETVREQARFRMIFDAVPVGISLLLIQPGKPETRLINDAHLRLCGITREQADDSGTFVRITHPDDRQGHAVQYRRVQAEEIDHYRLDKRYLHPDGQVIWVMYSFYRRKLGPGWFEDLTIVVDITERKQLEEAIRASEQSLTITLDSIGDAVLATDVAGCVTRLNPVAELLTGWPAAEACGRPVADVFRIVNEETRKPAEIPVDRVLATGQIHGLANHTVIIARDGTEHAISDSAAPIRAQDGHLLGVVLVFRDVTLERRAARVIEESARLLQQQNVTLVQRVEEGSTALLESERLARAALDALSAHVAILDAQGAIIATNQSWRDFAERNGLPAEQVDVGANYLAVCDHAAQADPDAAAAARGIREVMAGAEPEFIMEYTCHAPGEKRWFHCRVTRFPGAGAVRVVVAHENVTQMKLRERLLLRTQRMESLGTLASGVAHDLNNALSPIIMGAQMLRARYPQEVRILDVFESSAKRGASMVKQLMAFAKGTDGERVWIPLARLLKELEDMIRSSFPKNIQLVIHAQEPLPELTGDPTQIYQVLMNLCVNARDAMPAGGTLTVDLQQVQIDEVYATTVPEAHPGSYVVLRVRDTGTGIPAEILDRIFDPFFSTKSPDKGTGLGLATVQSIIRGHGGFIQVYSQPAKGTTFAAYFPAGASGGVSATAALPASTYRGQGEAILCVEDEPAVLLMTSEVLRRLNFQPIGAVDGLDGLVKLTEHRQTLRLVLTDLHMPHMDGLAFVRALRRLLPEIPVIVTSGQLQDPMAAEFRALGVTSFLDKPCTEEQLVAELRRALPGP